MSSAFLQNAWYQAAWSDEVTGASPLVRTLLDLPILLFRVADGEVAALHDRCPHRFARRSAGRIEGATVSCGYHGLGFDANGACAKNPHGGITSAMRVRSFPAVERHAAIWVWFGDEPANSNSIPKLSFIDDTPSKARTASYMRVAANYRLLTTVLVDTAAVQARRMLDKLIETQSVA